MPLKDPRSSAHEIVCQCLNGPTDLQQALDHGLENVHDARDKALITEIVYGYLRFRGRIDFVLDLSLDRPESLPPRLKILLGLAGYELFFLDRVPDYATVSRAVDLSARLFGRRMSGLVNAVLRRTARVDIFSENTFTRDRPDKDLFWSRFYSCPRWIVKMWEKAYGNDLCLEYLKQSLDKPLPGVREPKGFHGVIAEPEYIVERMGSSVLLKDNYPQLDQLLRQGRIISQSFAVPRTMHGLGMKGWAQPVWDMCAGSGGKTFLMLDQGMDVFSSDLNLKRLRNLKQAAHAYGYKPLIFAAHGDLAPLRSFPGTILIDAPCTGLGVLSRRPDIKWKRQPQDIRSLTGIQAGLLRNAASLSGDEGRIVYLTCTLSRDENEGRVNGFLREQRDFIVEKMFQTDVRQNLKEFFFGAVLKKAAGNRR